MAQKKSTSSAAPAATSAAPTIVGTVTINTPSLTGIPAWIAENLPDASRVTINVAALSESQAKLGLPTLGRMARDRAREHGWKGSFVQILSIPARDEGEATDPF